MVNRVTRKQLDFQLKSLNSVSKRRYSFMIAGIPSTFTLVVAENKAGGISTVSDGLTKRGMSDCLRAINDYIQKEKTEPIEKLD